jgi:voltage-gated potassium channel
MADQPEQPKSSELKSTGYELFILLLSLVSIADLFIMAVVSYVWPDAKMLEVVLIIDTVLTIFFVFDFCYRILTTSAKSTYFFKHWGWADLLACVPGLRIFRLFRVVRAVRLMRTFGLKNMVNEIIDNRADSALYITLFAVIILAETAAIMVLKLENANPEANITSGGDAVWWVFVTITTVGYGDRFPTTLWGRTVGVLVMFSGIALIGVLTGFLANFFLAPPKKQKQSFAPTDPKARLAELEAMLEEHEQASTAIRQKLNEFKEML